MHSLRSASQIFPAFHAYLRRSGNTKIVEIQWRNYRLPLLNSFSTAHGAVTAREGIIVQITTECGIMGIGEIAPLPAFGGGSLADASLLLPALVARLSNMTLAEALALVLAEGEIGPKAGSVFSTPTLCGLEIALLDALGKVEGCGVSTLLSRFLSCWAADTVPRTAVSVNAVIGAVAQSSAIAAAQEARANGFRCVKLKVGLGGSVQEESERVAAVRNAIGPASEAWHLRLDANEAWDLEEAIAILSQCIPYDIQYIEQPLKAHDLTGMQALRRAVSIPIAVDEALHSLESAQLILDNEAADVLIIKPQLVGGLRAGQRIIQIAAERGVHSVITNTIETGIGLVAALHLAAASPAVTLECGLATLPLLVDDLVMNDLSVQDGFLAVPTGPGLGITLDEKALNKYAYHVGRDESGPDGVGS